MAQAGNARCSFCGKRHDQVEKLIAGGQPGVFICDECVKLCTEIISDEFSPTAPKSPSTSGWMDKLRRMAMSLPR